VSRLLVFPPKNEQPRHRQPPAAPPAAPGAAHRPTDLTGLTPTTRARNPTRPAFAAVAGLSAIGTLLSRLTGLGRTLTTAYTLGANGVSDAYNLANTTPNIIYDLALGGILAGTLVPVFYKALNTPEEEGGEEAGWEAISAVCTAAVVVLLVVSVLFVIATPALIHLFTIRTKGAQVAAERRLGVSLLYLFVPQFFFYGLATLATAIMAARRRYAPAYFTPILNNIVVIGVLIAFASLISKDTPDAVRGDHRAVLLLGLGTTAGVVVMAVTLLPFLRQVGARLRWVWNPRHPACRTILRLSSWTFGFVVANQVAYLVIILLSAGHPGDYSAYSYAYLFMTLPYGVWVVSVMAPMETELAHAHQAGDRPGARYQLTQGIWLVIVAILPAALGMAVLARPAITLVLQHGNLSAAGARATSDALIAMALGLPTYSLYLVFMRAYQAMQDTRTMFLIYLVENGLNIVLDLALYDRFGIRGLAAGLSLAYAGGALVAFFDLRRRMGGIGGRSLASATSSVVVAAVVAAAAAALVATVGGHLPGGERQLGIALRVVLAVGAGVTVYYLAARALGFDRVRSRLLRRRPA
jgi:putative peptidoglycan lipid II flippase